MEGEVSSSATIFHSTGWYGLTLIITDRMNLFRKLLGSDKSQPPKSSSLDGEPIKVFDNFGRELLIARKDWVEGILKGHLEKEWNNPDGLAGIIIQSLEDEFYYEVEDAAKQLNRIDTNHARGATLLGVLYLQTNRPVEAQKVLSAHLAKYGKDGVVLTNLAKAHSAQGREKESLTTLWQALEADPNQENGMGWYEVIHRESGGEEGSLAALRRIAAIHGSWRAQLWLARHELEQSKLDAALVIYTEALERAPRPVPSDMLMQISGDLGNAGHLPELIQVVEPHFDHQIHGLQVGNNLIKAKIDTGQLDQVRELLDLLQSMQRPDWREHLGFWEKELQKARLETEEPLAQEQLKMSLLAIDGPLWLPKDHPIALKLPQIKDDALRILFSGSTFESPKMGDSVKSGPSDSPGRLSRGIPLILAEHLQLRCQIRTTTLIPWILNGCGGFALFGKSQDDQALVDMARSSMGQASGSADYVVGSHLLVKGENITVVLRFIRCIDGRCLTEMRHDFSEGNFHQIAPKLFEELHVALQDEAELSKQSSKPTLEGSELDHYLFRLEQALAVNCATMEERNTSTLSNPAEILDGMLHLCLQNPQHLASRMLLLRSLRKLKKNYNSLVNSITPKIDKLMLEMPIQAVQKELVQDWEEVKAM